MNLPSLEKKATKKIRPTEMAVSQKGYAWMMLVVAVGTAGFGLWGIVEYMAAGNSPAHPFNLGIILGYGAHIFVGVFVVLIADHLIKIEKRLDQMEKELAIKDKEKT